MVNLLGKQFVVFGIDASVHSLSSLTKNAQSGTMDRYHVYATIVRLIWRMTTIYMEKKTVMQ
ncbi:hypothetical protein COA09_19635 [Bacillus cereus]|nr:hypothetical protein COA09_19635 [Bacillus cereus]